MPIQVRFCLWFAIFCWVLAVSPARADIAYTTEIGLQGTDDPALLATLREVSQLVALEDRPPASEAALRRRTEEDVERLKTVAQAAGYWTPRLDYTVDTTATPAHVTVTVTPGPLFRLSSVAFRTPSGEIPALPAQLGPAAFGLEIGGPARSTPIEAAEKRITEEYAHSGYPFAKVTDRHAVADLATHTLRVTYTIDPGVTARFGAVTIEGLSGVERDFVERRITWQQGKPYDGREVETTRQNLVKSGLFSAVRISHAEATNAEGEVPMTISLVEGPPRSIGAGVAYNTNIGYGGQAFWENRNLFGEGERLRVTGEAAQKLLLLSLDFRKPDFIEHNQDFLANAELFRQLTPAYDSTRAVGFVGIERPLLPALTLGTGFDVEHANVTAPSGNENYTLLGLPSYLRRDTTDNLLDPTLGSRQTLTLTPYHGVQGPTLNFLSSRIEDRHYLRLDDTGNMVLAGYAALGSIVGESRDGLPADKRLYAGGAGSVRGYGYQRAGPLSPSNVPLGGDSSLEFGAEFRYRITDTIGIVPFLDAGTVYPTSYPNSFNLFYSGGIGLRYYTLIGPIRLDIAAPFHRRPGDSAVQIYISVGQAF